MSIKEPARYFFFKTSKIPALEITEAALKNSFLAHAIVCINYRRYKIVKVARSHATQQIKLLPFKENFVEQKVSYKFEDQSPGLPLMKILGHDRENNEILAGIANSNQRSFRQLFDLFSTHLIHFSQAILKNREAAVEVVDEVFVKLWKNRANATDIQNVSVYLYTAVKNSSLNHLSQKAKEQITDPFDFIDIHLTTEQNPEQQMMTAELFKKIETAVEELPPRCKMIFKLVREDGLKYKEVAEILNVSVNTVDAQMVIAVKRISEKMRNHLEIKNSAKVKSQN